METLTGLELKERHNMLIKLRAPSRKFGHKGHVRRAYLTSRGWVLDLVNLRGDRGAFVPDGAHQAFSVFSPAQAKWALVGNIHDEGGVLMPFEDLPEGTWVTLSSGEAGFWLNEADFLVAPEPDQPSSAYTF